MKTEKHPFAPFFPNGAEYLFMGSFPPKRERWSMEFYYPNFQNDMWRIFGLIFFGDKNYFVDTKKKLFNKDAITAFLTKQHIAMYDTAISVIRHKNNASDKDLEVAEAADIINIIQNMPDLRNIIVTGQKALETIVSQLTAEGIKICPPAIGTYALFTVDNRNLRLYRMPSSSRAYPLALEKKTEIYSKIFNTGRDE